MWIEKEYSDWKYGNVRSTLTSKGHKLSNGMPTTVSSSSVHYIDVWCKNCHVLVIAITHGILQSTIKYLDTECN